jgi:hypothetical protein
VIISAVFAALLAAFSPTLGLIFLIGIGGKYFVRNFRQIYVYLAVYSVTAAIIGLGLSESKPEALVLVLDLIVGVGIGTYIFFYSLISWKRFELALIVFVAFSVMYFGIRQFFLIDTIMNSITDSLTESFVDVKGYAVNSGLKESDVVMVLDIIKYIYFQFYIAICVDFALIGAYLGAIVLSKSEIVFWNHKLIRMPFPLVYLLAVMLIAFIMLPDKTYPIDGLFILIPFFLIQGIAVLDFFWGKFLAKTVVLRLIVIIVFLLYTTMWIVISFTGLFDVWFNFRKIYTKEDLDENHLS